jgi:hypothetical protein
MRDKRPRCWLVRTRAHWAQREAPYPAGGREQNEDMSSSKGPSPPQMISKIKGFVRVEDNVCVCLSVSATGQRYLDVWPGTTCSLAWQQTVTRLVTRKPVIESKHQLWPSPADLHLFVGSWRLGGNSICLCMPDRRESPRRPSWTACVHLRTVCCYCYSRYLSRWC